MELINGIKTLLSPWLDCRFFVLTTAELRQRWWRRREPILLSSGLSYQGKGENVRDATRFRHDNKWDTVKTSPLDEMSQHYTIRSRRTAAGNLSNIGRWSARRASVVGTWKCPVGVHLNLLCTLADARRVAAFKGCLSHEPRRFGWLGVKGVENEMLRLINYRSR